MAELDAPLLIVDGDNLAHRAYHSVPKSVKAPDGRPINALVGWATMLVYVWEQTQPRGVFVAWDTQGVPTYRHAILPTYQGGREFEEAIVEQLARLPDLSRAFGCAVAQEPGYEADDLMAAAALAETRRGGHCLLLTNDRDAYQLVAPAVTVLTPRSKISDLVRVGPAEVEERLGVPPSLVPDFKALAGDPSDNIPGARGIGPKKAAALLHQHGSLDGYLATLDGPDADGDRACLLGYREITRMRLDAVVSLPSTGPLDFAAAADALRGLGARTAADRMAARAAQPSLPG